MADVGGLAVHAAHDRGQHCMDGKVEEGRAVTACAFASEYIHFYDARKEG
jgi:hypothetical protein